MSDRAEPGRIDTPGGTAFGRYRLLEAIGRGGMAEVYKAKSFGVEGFEKVLVIKRIVPELAAHKEFVEMFVQEAKLAVRLSHANIVQVFDLGRIDRDDGGAPSYFIAMEYVPGLDLANVLQHFRRGKRQLPLGMAVFVASEVAKALDHAHRKSDEAGRALGIVHRDISPHNILLSWEGEVKVTDFGIAKAADSIARGERVSELEAVRATGKVSFMSPEQAKSEGTDARSDLFSLGAVMYEMVTGANPFAAPTVTETVRRIIAGEYPPVQLARHDCPAELGQIVAELLCADPARRVASAADLCERLLAYSYTSGERFDAGDLGALLAPLRDANESIEIEPTSVFDEPQPAADKTPVEIPHTSTSPPPTSSPQPGERREVTLLVLAFGASNEGAAPKELLLRARDVLERHGAWIEEQTQDEVVAIFGLGDTDGRDAEAAVRAGLTLVRERRAGHVPSVGVHSGTISVDDGGLPVKDERLAGLMQAVQALARATEGQVALSPVSGRLVRRSFVTEPLPGPVRAVADGGLVVRRALGEGSSRGRFIGRTAELKRLGGILALATRYEPQLVVMRGETGLGKSRLLGEAKRRLERGQFNVAFYSTSCPLNGGSIPFSGLKAMLHVLCGTQEDDDPERILEVRPRLRALGLREEQADAVLMILGAPVKTPASETRAVLRAGFERMVASLCHDRLHCFAWDDAQAIDRETLESILRVMRQFRRPTPVPGVPLQVPSRGLRGVFILAQRGEIPPALAKRKELHVLELEELAERDTAQLVETQLGARSVPKALLEYVRSCAGGHPLFVDELVRELCDSGIVQVLNGNVAMEADAHTSAPRTLRTLIADRVSRLGQRERRVLQGLAILGEPASTTILSSVLDQPLPLLDRHLSALEGKSLTRRTGPTQIRFASPLYLEIVLDAMPVTGRQELHARAAASYARASLPGAGEAAERVAGHLLAAGERRQAVDFYWQSAEDKLAAEQIEPALRVMLRGLELADPADHEVVDLLGWLGKAAATVSQVRQAQGLREALQPILRNIVARGDERQKAWAHIHAARAYGSVNLFDDAYQLLGIVDPTKLSDDDLRRESLSAEAEVAVRQGLFVRAVKAGDRLEELGLLDAPEAIITVALARAMGGHGERALGLMARVETLRAPKDAAELVVRQKHLVLIHFNRRDFETAARVATELSSIARAAGLRFDTAAALHNLGDIYDRLGDHPRAYAAFVESQELTRLLEHDRLNNLNQMHLCLLDGLRSAEGAEERLKACIRQADGLGWLWDVLEGRLLLARLAAARGEHERARQLLKEVTEMAANQGHRLIGVDAQELLAQLG
jgi:eukaryotic-like serine/threonine-protein kinase